MYRFDLRELEGSDGGSLLGKELAPLFGFNRWRPVSLWTNDYLWPVPSGQVDSIASRVLEQIRLHVLEGGESGEDVANRVARIDLVTGARFFGYVFNPVNFYYCYGRDESLVAHVVEINNTFGQRHVYVLRNGELLGRDSGKEKLRYVGAKTFFVSPFNRVEGRYEYVFSTDSTQVDVRIDLLNEGGKPFVSRLWGEVVQLSAARLVQTLLRFPLSALLTIPRIYWQAQRLRFQKKLPMLDPPERYPTLRSDAP